MFVVLSPPILEIIKVCLNCKVSCKKQIERNTSRTKEYVSSEYVRGDPFGAPTKMWPWEDGTNSVAMAKRKRANFELIDKLGVDFWFFHRSDIAPEGKTIEESNANLDEVVALAKELQAADKIRLTQQNLTMSNLNLDLGLKGHDEHLESDGMKMTT
ncbi:hypothetical protein RHMOL_Rhmol01G0082300 [Rhododendron molle]|uniref:Uncharacterized protein n=2 Tax=Rhododendron molle TaxID=49168 RepID=A0ACC0Q0P2_RHOML|nr:hypothetical protein RHMOL_Rhmol01G0082300 [Rhododendron molle]KAI8570997.1 hypothetical protein RHMOL_Rhmol01G0082300 [Rhododendron molle]